MSIAATKWSPAGGPLRTVACIFWEALLMEKYLSITLVPMWDESLKVLEEVAGVPETKPSPSSSDRKRKHGM